LFGEYCVCIGKTQQEFITTVARNDIRCPATIDKYLGNTTENFIANCV